jgi:hypothetical protein
MIELASERLGHFTEVITVTSLSLPTAALPVEKFTLIERNKFVKLKKNNQGLYRALSSAHLG